MQVPVLQLVIQHVAGTVTDHRYPLANVILAATMQAIAVRTSMLLV